MTIGFFRSDAPRNAIRSVGRNEPKRRSAVAQALTGVALAAMSLCAQGATDSSDPPAHATSRSAPLSMSPARIELSASTPRVVVTVHNDDPRAAMFVRMQPMLWTQGGIAPHYALTSDVIAQPATFVVAAGATQTVQVDLLSSANILHGEDFELFWQAQSEPSGGPARDERAAP